MKLQFSGHESFECRHFWLKKGYDHIVKGHKFNDEAVVSLGVGRNMVTSIKYWMRAYGLLSDFDQLTAFSHLIFSDKSGLDKYLEDEASLWLLHYRIVTEKYASLYNIVFNNLRKNRPEFTKDQALQYVKSKYGEVNESTFSKDFDAFTKTYITKGDDAEENYDGLLVDLDLVKETKRDKKTVFIITAEERNRIPVEVLLYCILQQHEKNSISFDELWGDENSVGVIFALDKQCLSGKLEELAEKYRKEGIVYTDNAGIKELQFKKKLPKPNEILTLYYEAVYAD